MPSDAVSSAHAHARAAAAAATAASGPAKPQGTAPVAAGLATLKALPQAYALVDGRYPDAVPLPKLLRAIGQSPEGAAQLDRALSDLQAKTGLPIPAAVRTELGDNAELFAAALVHSPEGISRGADAANLAYRAGKLPQVRQRPFQLEDGFDLADVAKLELSRPGSAPKQLAPGLWRGDLPSDVSDAQVKANVVLSEVFDRLAANAELPPAQRFAVTFDGRRYTRIEGLLGALQASGHTVKVSFERRIANIANLKTVVPGSSPPRFVDVPAPLMIRTGVRSKSGEEAVVPATHAEMVIRISSGPKTRGTRVDAATKFYQGLSGVGFFPVDVSQTPAWLGRAKDGELEGDDAVRAARLAAVLGDVVKSTANRLDLWGDGYGVTGLCNDTVAILQHALTGSTSLYPLLMRDTAVKAELRRRLGDTTVKRDDPDYRALLRAVDAVPSDATPNDTAAARALASLPWEPGKEPFTSTVRAREILTGAR